MDKYEYKQLSERMIELMQNEEYGEAKEIADSIDWRRVRNAMMLANVSDIYEKTGEYQKSYDILQIAYHRAEGSRKVLYRLSSLALKTGNVDEAIDFYDEFVQLAPKDPNRHILRYQILRAQRAPLEQQIEALEEFKKAEYIEEWAFELAKLYQEAGMTAECLEECDDLILWFSEGKYVYKAMELKMQYKPLTPSQQEKYNRRFEKNGGETEEIPDLETYVAENKEPEDHLDEAATEHAEAVSEEPVEDIPESIGQQDTGKEESSEKPVRKPEKKKIGDTMRLDEALEQLLHRKPEVSAAEDEEPDISDLESAIGDIESVVDLDMVNQISQEKHTGDVPIGMKELIPGEVSEEAADKTERIPVEITTEAPVAITDIQEISFQESGSMIPLVSYTTMTRENEGIRVQLELQYQYEYEKMMDASLMDQVQKILETYDVGKWNEFRGNDSMVLDGSSFSFHVTFTDGTSISASGNNAFPKNQRKVFSELNSLIAPVVEQWYQEQYPKMIEDNRINGFSFYVCSKDQAQKFEWRSEKRNDDPQADYLYADIVNIDQFEPIGEVEYFFYGKVPKLPYEELQEIVERFHLAEWNGETYPASSEQEEKSFRLLIEYQSGESIMASGDSFPDGYEAAEDAIISLLWDYIQENREQFVAWE